MAHDLEATARALVTPGKGILAADESLGTIKKRFDSIHIESTEENRRAYRELLLTTRGAEDHLSGVILFDETTRQKTATGMPFLGVLEEKGIFPGIKVDAGAKPLAFAPGEKVTEGLDGLRPRLEAYAGMGLRFAKWRAVIAIDVARSLPSELCLEANAEALARYAALSVEQGLVPIVEPEVLMNGPHTIDDCYVATERTLQRVYAALHRHRVPLEKTLLKPNMVLSGDACPQQAGPEQVAEATIRCFRRTVPAAVPGIVFLSGGQSEEQATENLNAMNARGEAVPWRLSFSYGRALQAPALQAWGGRADHVAAAQAALAHRASLNGAATLGEYSPEMEGAAVR